MSYTKDPIQDFQVIHPTLIPFFEKERELSQAIQDFDDFKINQLESEGASVNPFRYDKNLLKSIPKFNQPHGGLGAFGTAIKLNREDLVDQWWGRADFENEGFFFLKAAIYAGHQGILKKLLAHPFFTDNPPDMSDKGQNTPHSIESDSGEQIIHPLTRNKREWTDIAMCAMTHIGPMDNVHISNQSFDQVFTFFETHSATKEFSQRILSKSHGLHVLSPHIWKVIEKEVGGQNVYFSLVVHGYFEKANNFLSSHQDLFKEKDMSSVSDYDKKVSFMSSFINSEHDYSSWKNSVELWLKIQDKNQLQEICLDFIHVSYQAQKFKSEFKNALTDEQRYLFLQPVLKDFDFDKMVENLIEIKDKNDSTTKRYPLQLFMVDGLNSFLSPTNRQILVECFGADSIKGLPYLSVMHEKHCLEKELNPSLHLKASKTDRIFRL